MNKAVWPFSSTEWICSGIRYLMISIFHRKQRTALHLAAASGHDDVARLLLTSGSDILAVDMNKAVRPFSSTEWICSGIRYLMISIFPCCDAKCKMAVISFVAIVNNVRLCT
jgi:hypothetical protein